MPLTIIGNEEFQAGIVGVTISGMAEIISVTVRRTNTTQIEAKKSDGDLAAIAFGGEKYEFEAEGYTTEEEVPVLTNATWTAYGLEGNLMSLEIVASNEDFMKVRVSGIGFEGAG